jgi:DNA-binding GntR family transcriptional regulator
MMAAVRKAFFPEPLTPTLPLQIADRIGAAIVDERFPPAERLKEVELASMFSVSRATVREALRILENRGLVSILPQRGAQVTSLSRKELEDMFEVRAVLLGQASRRVAMTFTPETERRMLAGMQALQAARRDAAAYARASADLALEITRLSGNLLLVDHITMFAQRIGRYARMGLSSQARRDQSFANWRKLFQAMASRDGDMAEAMHRRLSTQNGAAALAELDRRELGDRAMRDKRGDKASKERSE